MVRFQSLVRLTAACLAAIAGVEAQQRDPAADFLRARELLDSGQPQAAIPIYEALRRGSPEDPRFLLALTVATFKAGRYRDAIPLCRELLSLSPRSLPARLFLGASYFQLGEPDSAIGQLSEVVRLSPNERNARLMLAEAWLLTARHDEALPHFRVASDLLPNDPRPWYGLNRVYAQLRRAAEDRLTSEFPDSGYSHAALGERHERAGNYGIAARQLLKAVADQSVDAWTRQEAASLLGKIYVRSGHSDWAALIQSTDARAPPNDCAGDSSRHACRFRAGQFQEILEAGPAEPGPEFPFWRARAYSQLAKEALERLGSLGESPQLHEIAARDLDERGKHRLAAARWQQAVALDRANRVLKLGLAVALYESHAYDEALPLVDDLVATTEGTADLLYLRGTCLLGAHRAVEAARDLAQAVALDPLHESARAELSRAHLLNGEPDLAIRHLLKIVGSDEDGSYHYRLARAYEQTGQRELAKQALGAFRGLMLAHRDRQQALMREYSEIPPPPRSER